MKVIPLRDRVLVKRKTVETRSAGGIVIPDQGAEKPDQGEVIAVGLGKRNEKGERIPLDVKAGDQVLFGKFSGQTVKVDREEFLVMSEDDIMAQITK